MKKGPLKKEEVIKAIEKRNPRYIPGWYSWIADETWEKYGDGLKKLLENYTDDIMLIDYDTPEGFVEPAPGRDEFHVYYVDKPGVFSGMRTSDLKNGWKKVERLGWMICNFLCGIVDGFAEAGMDGIFFSDDLGFSNQLIFSPEIFRDMWKPWYKKLFERIRSHDMHVINT